MKTLVIASGNAGKIREFQGLLRALPVSVQPPPQVNGPWPTIQA